MTEVFGLQDKLAIIDKKVESYTGTGIDRVSSTQLDLEVGKKYYFVVATVDSINRGTDRSAAGKYIANVAKVPGAVNNVSFDRYSCCVDNIFHALHSLLQNPAKLLLPCISTRQKT